MTNFIRLLLSEWQKANCAAQLQGRQIFFVCGNISLTSAVGITVESSPVPTLSSSQEEADIRIMVHCFQVATSCTSDFIVRSHDTAVFMLLLYYSNRIEQYVYFDTGFANKRHVKLMCSAMLALHAFSGCDSTSAFIRKEKITARKTLVKHAVFVDVFGTPGETDDVPECSQTELEKFVCCVYGKPSYKDVCLRMPLTLIVTTMRRTYVWPAYWTPSTMTEMMILKTTQLHQCFQHVDRNN